MLPLAYLSNLSKSVRIGLITDRADFTRPHEASVLQSLFGFPDAGSFLNAEDIAIAQERVALAGSVENEPQPADEDKKGVSWASPLRANLARATRRSNHLHLHRSIERAIGWRHFLPDDVSSRVNKRGGNGNHPPPSL